jgi:hypothetical protein
VANRSYRVIFWKNDRRFKEKNVTAWDKEEAFLKARIYLREAGMDPRNFEIEIQDFPRNFMDSLFT